MPPHPLTNVEIHKYYQNKTKFKSVYSRNNLPKVQDGPYEVNLVECNSIGTHWIALYKNGDNVTYFDSFGDEYIPKEIKKFISNKYQNKTSKHQISKQIFIGYKQMIQ